MFPIKCGAKELLSTKRCYHMLVSNKHGNWTKEMVISYVFHGRFVWGDAVMRYVSSAIVFGFGTWTYGEISALFSNKPIGWSISYGMYLLCIYDIVVYYIIVYYIIAYYMLLYVITSIILCYMIIYDHIWSKDVGSWWCFGCLSLGSSCWRKNLQWEVGLW